MGKKRLLVLSVDAMVFEDLETAKNLPNLGLFLEQGSRVNRMRSVYPALTYPAHATIMTGCYPECHGIVNNEQLMVGTPHPEWHTSIRHVQVETVFHAAKKAGYATGAVHWPVTADADCIDYLIGEVWCWSPQEDPGENYARRGARPILDTVVRKNLHLLDWVRRPQLDQFAMSCGADIIRQYKPEVLFLHQAWVDKCRHTYGVFNDKVTQALVQSDQWLGEILDAAKEAGVYEDTNFVVLSDHGQLDTRRNLNLNVLLVAEGLIQLDQDGGIGSWDAFIKCADLSAQVYLRDPEDKALYDRVHALLRDWLADGLHGISELFTAEEAQARHHLSGGFSFVIESDGFTCFTDGWRPPLVEIVDLKENRYYQGEHGHLPHKGPQPVFLVMGPGFKKGVVLEEGVLVDEAPTFAKLLDIPLPQAQGKPILELLAD